MLARPILAGAAMALLMLFLMHDAIMSGTASFTGGALAFIGAHVALAGAAVGIVLVFPKARGFLRTHRPSVRHLAAMAAGMAFAAGTTHAVMHWIV